MILPERVPGDTTITGIFPAAIYTSDVGLLGAVLVSRYRYHPRIQPYVSRTELGLEASTRGLFSLKLKYEQTETFGRPVRSRWRLDGEKNPVETFFGIGNDTGFDKELWDDGYYYFEVYRAGFEWMGRHAVYRNNRGRGSGGQLDVTATLGVHYEKATDRQDELMGEWRPRGIEGGFLSKVGAGLLWENRDNEFAATRGNRLRISGTWAPGGITGEFPMAKLSADIRQYVTLPVPYFRPVLAARTVGVIAHGSVPYWEQPYLGDHYTVRGYPFHRFRGNASVLYNLELRTWVYEYPEYSFRLGVHTFHDGGRVFAGDDGLGDLFRDYHRTFGGGIAISIFSPDLILRLDAAFSDEMFRFYGNVGYMF
ncbi:BamA/TamA family outer membrane protein [Balneolales bacterium ANBcel1]|nr:BamA/TamA family outer membrane protein [Balneolales bacterium ANBcel1]